MCRCPIKFRWRLFFLCLNKLSCKSIISLKLTCHRRNNPATQNALIYIYYSSEMLTMDALCALSFHSDAWLPSLLSSILHLCLAGNTLRDLGPLLHSLTHHNSTRCLSMHITKRVTKSYEVLSFVKVDPATWAFKNHSIYLSMWYPIPVARVILHLGSAFLSS